VKLEATRKDLLSAVAPAAAVADRKSTLAVLANVLLRVERDELHVAGSDLVTSVQARAPVARSEAGAITLDARKLLEILKSAEADATISIAVTATRAEIRAGKSRYAIAGLPASDFPKLPPHAELDWCEIRAALLGDALARVAFAACVDTERHHMSGVSWQSDGRTIRTVATDGHRLAHHERDVGCPELKAGVILPRLGIAQIARALDSVEGDAPAGVAFTKTHAFVRVGNLVLSAQLVQAQFPPVGQVMPTGTPRHVAVVDRAALLAALGRVGLMRDSKTDCVQISLSAGAVRLDARSADDDASDEVPADVTGAEFSAGLNQRYVAEALVSMDCSEVRLEAKANGEMDPVVFRPHGEPSDSRHVCIIMPLRQ
jgi:DNA polymerase-3 subunit beta